MTNDDYGLADVPDASGVRGSDDPYDIHIKGLQDAAFAAAIAAKEARDAADQALNEAMRDAWEALATYAQIGRVVGMSKQAAHYRIHKAAGGLECTYTTAAEDVPVGATVASPRRGGRPAVVADKRVGSKNVTFYDENDEIVFEAPLGTSIAYTPSVDDGDDSDDGATDTISNEADE